MLRLLLPAAVGVICVVLAGMVLRRGIHRHKLVKRFGKAAAVHEPLLRWREDLPVVLILAALLCMAVTFGGTRFSSQRSTGTVVLTMDTSRSMEQTDVLPSRLEAAQVAAKAFLNRLPEGFDVGVVTFSGKPSLLIAPTPNRSDVAQALEKLSVGRGTVIGDGLSSALDAIQHARDGGGGGGPAAVVLLSDGQDTGSEVTPTQAAARAHQMGVPVYTVTLGVSDPAAKGSADSGLLRSIANTTGGRAFTSQTADGLTRVYDELGSTLSYDLKIGGSAKTWVILAVILVLAAGAIMLLPSEPRGRRPAKRRAPAGRARVR
jgi:Ca-activated chloride channel family protein